MDNFVLAAVSIKRHTCRYNRAYVSGKPLRVRRLQEIRRVPIASCAPATTQGWSKLGGQLRPEGARRIYGRRFTDHAYWIKITHIVDGNFIAHILDIEGAHPR